MAAAPKQYQYLAVQLQKLWGKCERRLQQEALDALISGEGISGGVADQHEVSHDFFEPSEIEGDGSPEGISFRHSFAEAPKAVVHDAKGTVKTALEESFGTFADRSSYIRDTSDRVGWEIGAQALADVVASQMRHALRRWETFTRRKRLGDLQSTVMLALQGVPNLAALAGQGARHHAQPSAAVGSTRVMEDSHATQHHQRPSTNSKPAALARDALRDDGLPGSKGSPLHDRAGGLTMATLAAETLQEHGTSSHAISPQHSRSGLAMAALAGETLQEGGAGSHSPSFALEGSVSSPARSSAAGPDASPEACLQCGTIHAADAVFCKKCGTKRQHDFLRQESQGSRHASLEHAHREARPPNSAHMPGVGRPGSPLKEHAPAGGIVPGFAAEVLAGAALEAKMSPRWVASNKSSARSAEMQNLSSAQEGVFQPNTRRTGSQGPNSVKQGDDFVRSLYADQKRVDEIIKLATILWDSGALVAHTRPLPLLRASLAFRTSERCLKHCLRDAFHSLWKRCIAKRLEDELLARGTKTAASADDVQGEPNADGTSAYLLEGGRAPAAGTAAKSGAVHQPDPEAQSAHRPATPTDEEHRTPAAAADSSADDRAAKLEEELRKAQAKAQEWQLELKSYEEEKEEKEKEIERLREQLQKAQEAAKAAEAEAAARAAAAVPAKREVVAQDVAATASTRTVAAPAMEVPEAKVEEVKAGPSAMAALAGDALMQAASTTEKEAGVTTPPDSEAAAEDGKPGLGASLVSSEGMNFSDLGLGKDSDEDDAASINDDELADLLG
eukprot:TRINITY_DN59091_c0_g1_i1.p1 TRINITY_DN59091_c0_g1~~TRINITY_DN59091_c0_g1_i1.p1  ORF type:complete len:788 (-),score=172.90 TRINITY_DN59091_c0_g1_i1:85-2448(-)